MSAAPRGPENIDGSSYLYISLVRLSPLASADAPPHGTTHARVTHIATRVKKRANRRSPLFSRSVLQSLRQVKSLTHIPPALQAGFRAARRSFRPPAAAVLLIAGRLQISDRAQGCAAHL